MSFVLSVRPCLTRVFENHDIVIDASGLTQGGVALLYNSITNIIFVFSNSWIVHANSSFVFRRNRRRVAAPNPLRSRTTALFRGIEWLTRKGECAYTHVYYTTKYEFLFHDLFFL